MRAYIFIYLFYTIFIVSYFASQYKQKVVSYHKNTIAFAQKTLQSTVGSFELTFDSFHAIYADEISKIVAQSNGADKEKRDLLRYELSRLIIGFYDATSLESLTGLMFVDKDGRTLLRMHNREHYDDNVAKYRDSFISLANDHLYKKGLEVGREKDAYRYQFPLFYDGEYVGAYEYSVRFESMLREMKKIYANQYILLLDKELIETEKLQKIATNSYEKIDLKNKIFYYNRFSLFNNFEQERFEYILNNSIIESLFDDEIIQVIDYEYNTKYYSLVSCPLKDINQKKIGYILIDILDSPVHEHLNEMLFEIIITLTFGLFVLIFIYKQKKHNQYVREILNVQKQMLIVTNGESLVDANDSFFKFFGYKNIKEFLDEHTCVCDFFIEEEHFLQKYNDGVLWTDFIKLHSEQKHYVRILHSKSKMIKTFELEWEFFERTDNLFISFRDVTEEIEEKKELQSRANFDTLTGIYNRERFNYYLEKKIRNSSYKMESFSLIMFDIDHFKKINDTLGHDVGDIVLQELSSLILSKIREDDIFARWGGEEFMIIASNKLESAHLFADKLRRVIEAHDFKTIGDLRCSFGVAEYHLGETSAELAKRVDEMLYKAKHSGRNCVVSALTSS